MLPAASCSRQIQEQDSLKVLTTIYPLYDITRNIAEDRLEVVYIIQPGESPHTFELTPDRVRQLQGAEIAFKVGLGLDDWLDDTIAGLGMDTAVVEVNDGIDLIREDNITNPHIWLSISNSMIIVENITDQLIQSFPQYREEFEENKQKYLQELKSLETRGENDAKEFKKREFIAFHDAWSYLARDLNIVQVMSVEPFPGKEPAPDYVIELYKTVRQYGIGTIFVEPQLSADMVNYLARRSKVTDTGAGPAGTGEDKSDIELMHS
ncbi:MAG: metal ABC transporter substrate-binding protein [Actinomycetota bacterium]|nr:metal ABC transporter substrate-binding protein [Actinomycetota bacterium]